MMMMNVMLENLFSGCFSCVEWNNVCGHCVSYVSKSSAPARLPASRALADSIAAAAAHMTSRGSRCHRHLSIKPRRRPITGVVERPAARIHKRCEAARSLYSRSVQLTALRSL